jgi:hypothetical protein
MNLDKVSGQNPMVFVYKDNVRKTESGNIFIAIFGAIALIGILGASVMTFMKGPLSTSVKLTKINTAENQMAIGSQVAVMATANQPNNGDCETAPDGFVEPLEWRTATTEPIPTNGGLVPLSLGITKKDPWGTEYGYCVWNHGPVISGSGCGANMLAGTNSRIYPVVSVISAGPDKAFTTTCRSFATADANADGDLLDVGDLPMISKAAETDDDIITSFTYEEATGVSGGLWSLKSGDPGTAVIGKNIETTGVANLGGGLLLPDKAFVDCSLPSNAGVMAKNGNAIEICDGAGTWTAITGGGGGPSGTGLVVNPNTSSGMNITAPCGSSTCYSTNVVFTVTNKLAPPVASDVLAVTLTNTADFEKVSDNCNGQSIAANGTCQIVVRARATGDRSYTAQLQIVGNNSPFVNLDGTSTGFGCNKGGDGPGGKYVGCGLGGGTYNLVATTADVTGYVFRIPGTTTEFSSDRGGVQNNVDFMAYAGPGVSYPAIEYCMSLNSGGFDDWYLPASSEFDSHLRTTSGMGLTYGTVPVNFYHTSTPYWSSNLSQRCNSSSCGDTGNLSESSKIRCVRRDNLPLPSPTPDTTPAAFSFTPASTTTAGTTLMSNTVTISGVTSALNISISGGTAAQFSKNGTAYTSTATTVTNGDTLTLRATSPIPGQQDVVTLTVAGVPYLWNVRTVANNTIYGFITTSDYTGGMGGVGGADGICNSEAAAAGLGGSWTALLGTGGAGSGPMARMPWNWTTLRNMNNATVATGLNDFTDGTWSAPINRTANNTIRTGSNVWSGASDNTGLSGQNGWTGGVHTCSSFSSGSGGFDGSIGSFNSTTSPLYNGNTWSTFVSCSGSYPIYCIQDPGSALVDTDPAQVSIRPGIAYSPGAVATSNTVTITSILQPITITMTPSAGTGDIIVNGVSVGGTTATNVAPNSTVRFSLTVPATLGQRNTASLNIGDDLYSWWVGYADIAKEAKVFVTSTVYGDGGTWPGIGNLDSACTSVAASSPYGLSGSWKWLGSTTSSDAANVIPWNWGVLKNMLGDVVVDGGFVDLFDGTIDMPIRYDQNGNNVTANVYTVSTTAGIRSTTIVDQGGALTTCNDLNGYPYNGQSVTVGNAQNIDSRWISSGGVYCPSGFRLYCIENVDTAVPDTTPNQINLDYIVQVSVSSRQTSPAVIIGGLSSGSTATLSVSAPSGTPRIKVNGGPEVASASVSNGDSVVFLMDAPATANSSNTMTITAGTMTTTWRVWSGWDGIGTGVKRVFVTSTDPNGAAFGGVTGADTHCQSRAAAAGLGGTWRAIISSTAEATWAVNRVGYNWAELQLVDGTTTVAYAPNLWSTLLNPIIQTEFGATRPSTRILSGTASNGKTYSTTADLSNMFNWTNASCSATYMQGNSSSLSATITQGYWLCQSDGALYCIEQ